MIKLEICVDSIESVMSAASGGADRIELCSNLSIGGTTPSPMLIRQARRSFDGAVHVMIRPRFGDFCYNKWEFDEMLDAVRLARVSGADGIVVGILTADGRVDEEKMYRLREAAKTLKLTFHRAFDMTCDAEEALKACIATGADYILTSGGKQTALAGSGTIARLVSLSSGKVNIMPGAGINRDNIVDVMKLTKSTDVHMSAKKRLDSPMRYRNSQVSMGAAGLSEYERWQADEAEIRYLRELLNEAFPQQ